MHPAAAAAFVLLLAVVNHGFSRLWPRVLEASPVEDAAVTARFQAMLARSQILAARPRTELLRAAPRGGTWADAVGLPHPRHQRVLLADSVLQKLDLDELGALFAQRLAILELFQGPGLFLRALLRWVLPAIVGVLAFATVGRDPLHGPLLYLAWILAVNWAFAFTLARNGRREILADKRAVELCGDPEALVRALTKLYGLANLPSRWDADTEQALHAGLASRIRGIRESVGQPVAGLSEEIVLPSSERGRFAVFGPEQICFLDGVTDGDTDASALRQRAGSSRSFAYRSLSELHLSLRLGRGGTLRAATRDGHQVLLPVADGDVKLAQNALEAIDGKLGRTGVPYGRVKLQAVLAAAGILIGAMLPGMPGPLALLAFLVLLRPQVAALLGTGVAASSAGAFTLLQATCGGAAGLTVLGAALSLAGGAALLVAARRLARLLPEATWRNYGEAVLLLLVLAATSLPLAITLAMSPFPEMQSMAGAGPAMALALGVVILARYRARLLARIAGGALFLAALAPTILGSDTFHRLRGNNPLGGDAPRPRLTEARLAGRAITIPANVTVKELSPTGQRFIGILNERGRRGAEADVDTYVIGNGAGEAHRLRAVALTFMTDSRLMAVVKEGGTLYSGPSEGPEPPAKLRAQQVGRLRTRLLAVEVAPDGSRGSWQVALPPVEDLRLAATETRFRVIGDADSEVNEPILIEGEVGRPDVVTTHAPAAPTDGHRTGWIPSTAGQVSLSVVVEPSRSGPGFFGDDHHATSVLLLHAPQAAPRKVLETSAQVQCPDVPLAQAAQPFFLCVAHERGRTVVLSIPHHAQAARPVLRLPFRHYGEVTRAGHTLAVRSPEGHLLLDPDRGTGLTLAVQPSDIDRLVLSEGAIALVPHFNPTPTPVTIYTR